MEYKILIAHNDINALSKMTKALKHHKGLSVDYTDIGSHLIDLLKNNPRSYNCIFLSTSLQKPEFHDQTRYVLLYQPKAKIYGIDFSSKSKRVDLSKATDFLEEMITQEVNFLEAFKEIINKAHFEINLRDTNNSQLKLNEESNASNKDFIAISKDRIIIGKTTSFEIFIKLSHQKYIKVLNKDSTNCAEVLTHYSSKVEYYYIHKNDISKYAELCLVLTKKLRRCADSDQGRVGALALNATNEAMAALVSSGLDLKQIVFLEEAIDETLEIVSEMAHQSKHIKSFINSAIALEHSILVSFIFLLLAKEVGILGLKNQREISMAALLHDIGIFVNNDNFSFNESPVEHFSELYIEYNLFYNKSLNETESAALQNHAQKSYSILSSLNSFSELTLQLIQQHESSENETLKRNDLLSLSKLLQLSDLVAKILQSKKSELKPKFIEELTKKLIREFKASDLDILKKVLSLSN